MKKGVGAEGVSLSPQLLSGISSGEKMENAVDRGGVADMTHFELKVKVFFKTIDFHSESRTVREMIHDSVDFAQVNWRRKKFHVLLIVREVSGIDTLINHSKKSTHIIYEK